MKERQENLNISKILQIWLKFQLSISLEADQFKKDLVKGYLDCLNSY